MTPRPKADHRSPSAAAPSPRERLSVAVDVALLTVRQGALHVLVGRRSEPPYAGRWALAGGFVRADESLDASAARVLHEETGLERVYLEQLYSFGEPGRDPRGRVISVAYYALVHRGRLDPAGGNGTCLARIQVPWQGEAGGPVDLLAPEGKPLATAFDHAEIVGMAVKRLRGKLDYVPIGFQLLPPRFTLRQLQHVHEVILDRALNKDSFRRRMLASGLIEATGEREREVGHRPAALYRFLIRSAV